MQKIDRLYGCKVLCNIAAIEHFTKIVIEFNFNFIQNAMFSVSAVNFISLLFISYHAFIKEL